MQDVRREKHLQHQKARRDDFMNISRCLADGELDEEMGEEEDELEGDSNFLSSSCLTLSSLTVTAASSFISSAALTASVSIFVSVLFSDIEDS